MLKDISYKDYRRSDDIHGTVLYPAVMVAPVQKAVLQDLRKKCTDNTIRTIFDPFHGSGTALYESHLVFPEAQLYGCDINPLANLITKVKLTGVPNSIDNDISLIETHIRQDKSTIIFEFPNRQKWFRDDIALSLTKVRNAIIATNDTSSRTFFWCMMSDVIRRYSNSRSSTYKLHIKPKDKIDAMPDRVIPDFIRAIKENKEKYTHVHFNGFTLYKQDVLSCLKTMDSESIDLIITSPPYGDNNTTVPYGLFSSLALRWIDKKDLSLEGWELDNYSIIDNRSLGNGHVELALTQKQKTLLTPYLTGISDVKKKKVYRFFHDYFLCLDNISRVSNRYIVLTLGNRTVDRVRIDLARITNEYLTQTGYAEYQVVSRDILNKRTPPITSIVRDEPVESMKKEYMLIFEKR